MASNGQTGLTKSMNGIVYFDDGNGFTTDGSGDITCNTLYAQVLNIVAFVITTLTCTSATITTLVGSTLTYPLMYIKDIRSSYANPTILNDTGYTSVDLVNGANCNINIGGSQTSTTLNLGTGANRSGGINIANGTNNTGQVNIKQFLFLVAEIAYSNIATTITLFRNSVIINLGSFKFISQALEPATPASLTTICSTITTGGLLIGSTSMNSDINIINATGRVVNIPNLVVSSLTGVSGNFDVAGTLTAGTSLSNNRIGNLYIQNQTITAVDPTQPIQFGTNQTGNLNIGSATSVNRIGGITFTSNNISASTGTLNLNPTVLQFFSNPFKYVPWTVYNNIANSGSVFVKATITNPLYNYISSTLQGSYTIMGKSMYVNYYFYQGSSAGTSAGNGVYLFPLPSGYMIDTTKVTLWPNTANNQDFCSAIGQCNITSWGVSNSVGAVYGYIQGGVSYVVLFVQLQSTNLGAYTAVANNFYQSTTPNPIYYRFNACIPIV